MAKSALSFVCQNCGAAYSRWQGKCEACGEWNTLAEEDTIGATSAPVSLRSKRKGRTFKLESLTGKSHDAPRLSAGMAELDRVTGGGLVRGSVLLVGGDPGIGKSTLLTQVTSLLARAGHQAGCLRQQRRFADTGIAADQQHRAAYKTAAGDAVEFAQSGRQPRRVIAFAGQRFQRKRPPPALRADRHRHVA